MKRRLTEWCWRHPGATFRIVTVSLALWAAHYMIMESSLPAGMIAVVLFVTAFWGVKIE